MRIATFATCTAMALAATPRYLPAGPLNMGYSDTASFDQIMLAAESGLNVIIWSFITLGIDMDGNPTVDGGPDPNFVVNISTALQNKGLVSSDEDCWCQLSTILHTVG